MTPQLISASIGAGGKSLDVEWQIISYSPILEYKVQYRNTKASTTIVILPVLGANNRNLLLAQQVAHILLLNLFKSWVTVIGTVSCYGLDNQGVILSRAKEFFSSLYIQTGFGAHSASYPMGSWGCFPGSKVQLGHDTDYSPPSKAKVKTE
jgi:hypothetical protein